MASKKNSKALTPSVSPEKAVSLARSASSASLENMREQNALKLFRDAAKRVPAYRDFLKKYKINPAKVRSWNDFHAVPQMSKPNYLRLYPLAKLCWDGTLARPSVFSATSGSTGKPTYFQRSQNLELEYSALVELFLSQGAHKPSAEYPTLVIIGFGMGVWIGGMLTFRAYEIASGRGYPLSILPAGVNKAEILSALRDLAPQFKQTILIGYPPFIKDVLDGAEDADIDLSKLNMRLMFAAESFTERFRDYVGDKAGIKNVVRDTLSIYGTADIGAMAYETPTAILIRRLAMSNEKVFARLFGNIQKTPTLAQYHPAFMTFETNENGEILLTGNSAIPLIRYAIGDHGGVRSFAEVDDLLKEEGIDLAKETRKAKVPLYKLPFVYVYARVDLSTKLYGAIIYPEHVRDALEEKEMQESVTGKFAIMTTFDKDQNQALEVNVELRKGVVASDTLLEKVQKRVLAHLLEKNSEYKNNHSVMADRVLPNIVFWRNEDPKYFTPGIKQKWVILPSITQQKK